MACGCKSKGDNQKYKWTGSDGSTVTYDTELQAKAKVLRKGGTYTPVPL